MKRFTLIFNALEEKKNFFKGRNPFGDGKASERIKKIILKELK
jgi:UDP-N-acetylglucosamine 2-epimerase